ncbi:tRNA (32-2'-O)-methyltransferase regulator THADA-like [Lethenteron reissneri]|uniref:tRNA (32-2'-O)-methyltransferase regulator THADA-like n=1 Tax=Lethenteron reissneri TaxID=7753 RepID=UPI002AB79789|nr:tRNA (32-2'-O)-methyltransferase regulator THADA-like [Lethenteron reissneri]
MSEKNVDVLCFGARRWVLWLWMRCVRNNWRDLADLVPGRRVFPDGGPRLDSILLLLRCNWESPVEGVVESVYGCMQLLLELYAREHQEDIGCCVERPLFGLLLRQALGLPWESRGRPALLRALLPHVGARTILEADADLPQQMLSCLSTNYLAPLAAELYKELLKSQRDAWESDLSLGPCATRPVELPERKQQADTSKPRGHPGPDRFAVGVSTKSARPEGLGAAKQSDGGRGDGGRGGDGGSSRGDAGRREARQDILMPELHAKESRLAEMWAGRWLKMLHSALTSGVSLLLYNVSSYLLPCTLKVFPETFALMNDHFSGPNDLLPWINLVSVARSVLNPGPEGRWAVSTQIRRCLRHRDEGVRAAALAFVCVRAAQPARRLVRLPPAAAGRRAARAERPARRRAGGAAAGEAASGRRRRASDERAGARSPGVLDRTVEFVDWLLDLCLNSLFPGASFQRKKMCLLLLSTLLETFSVVPQPEKKKGKPPEDVKELVSWARHRGRWDFCSQRSVSVLCVCLRDGTNEVRELAAELLQGFFPAEALLPWRDVLSSQAAALLRSPKAPEAEAGALLLKLVYHKLVVNSATSRAQGADSCQDAAAEFVSEVVATLQTQFECAQTSILEASMTMPMHGAIMALRRCLTEIPESLVLFGSSQNSAAQRGLIPRLVAMAAAISRFILRVLYGAPHGGSTDLGTDAVPSFAEIGRAVERVVAEGKGVDSEGRAWDDVLISHEHSHILSCCWLTLKEIGHLMGGLGETVLLLSARDQRAAGAGTPFFALVQTITDVLKLILTCCRHKGAIDGCSLGFVKLCGALSSHPSPALQNIPSILLEEALACVGTSSSVTRRAGALPPLVLGLVSGECRSRGHCPLLRRALGALLRLAARPLPAAIDPTRDLPQVHALHILQALFRDSSLGAAMMESAGGAALLAIRSLSSPSWAVRNGAIQLFGTLVGRMLGQMRTHDEHSPQNAVTAGEFLRHYPELPAFLLSELRAAAAPLLGGRDLELLVAVAAASGARPPAEALAPEGRAPAGSGATEGAGGVGGRGPWEGSRPSGRLHLSPSLHPVLTLLSKLQPGGEDSHSLLSEFVAPVVALASDPIHDVRVLAAKTLVVMVTRSRRAPMLIALATALPERWCPLAVPQNALHGRLLQMLALLKCLLKERGGALEQPVLHSLVAALASRRWLLGEARVCPLSRALAVRLLATLARAHGSHPGIARLSASLHAIAQDELLLLHQPAAAREIGAAALRGELAAFVLTLALGAPAGPCDAPAVLRLLRCRDVDVRRRSREWLAERGRGSHGADAAARIMLEDLHRVLYEESDRRCLGLHLEACVALLDSSGGLGVADCEREGCEESVRSLLALAARGEDCAATFDPVLAARALRMAACLLPRLVSDRTADERTLPLIERWSLTLETNASDSSPDVLRLAAASSLRLAGRVAVTFGLRVRGRALPIAVRLARAAVLLLCDEEEAARLDAACFASCFSELELEGEEEEATPSPLPQQESQEGEQEEKEATPSPLPQQERREGEQEEQEDAAATGPLGAPPSEPVHGGVATRLAAAFLGRLARRRCWEALVALHGFLALPDVGAALHVHAAVSSKPLNLFEQEEGSAYGEPLALARLAAPLLEQAVVSWAAHPEGRSLLGAWLLSGIASTGSLLQHCRQFHSQCGGPAEVFAAVQQNRPYTALHILRLDLLLLARAGEALEETGPCPTLLPAEPEDREPPWDSAARGPGVLSVRELRRQAEWLNQELLAPFSALSSSKAT